METWAQILGIIAIVISSISIAFKSKTKIMLFCTIYNILTLTTYLLLGKYLGCILVGVLTLKSFTYFIFSLKNLKPNIFVLLFFEISLLVISIVFWSSWVDIFMIANSVINTYFSWQENVILIKISAVVCSILLILYDIFVGAYAYIISEVLYGAVALITLIMLSKQNKKENLNHGKWSSHLKKGWTCLQKF